MLTRHMAEIRSAFAEPLAAHFHRTPEDIRDQGLGAGDFSLRHHVEITLPDGSRMEFRHAFFVVDREHGMVGIFSEHCGYYAFCGPDLKVSAIWDTTVISTVIL